MADEKRMIQSYEVKNAIHIGGREIILAEDLASTEPYMVCFCAWDNPFGAEIYDKAVVGADYLEAMNEFLGRVSAETQRIHDQRAERGVTGEPLTAADCIPESQYSHYEGQLVVIRPEKMVASARSADNQLLLATAGNGCNPDARGQAVFCKNLFTGKTIRWERTDVAGIILPERVPAWARQKLAEMRIAQTTANYIQGDAYSIYQLKNGDETREYRFEPLERLEARGLSVDPKHYDQVYTAPLTDRDTLDSIFARFNTDHPPDFQGHSLSVSDIIVFRQNGETTAHYVDAAGFKEVPGFLGENAPPPVIYMGSLEEAMESNAVAAFHKSHEMNTACAKGIDQAIRDCYKGDYRYDLPAALKAVTAEYGAERVHLVLANTMDRLSHDGRFSQANKDWGKGLALPRQTTQQRSNYVCGTHSAILDGFINHARKAQPEKEKRPSVMDSLKAQTAQAKQKPPVAKKKDKSRQEGR